MFNYLNHVLLPVLALSPNSSANSTSSHGVLQNAGLCHSTKSDVMHFQSIDTATRLGQVIDWSKLQEIPSQAEDSIVTSERLTRSSLEVCACWDISSLILPTNEPLILLPISGTRLPQEFGKDEQIRFNVPISTLTLLSAVIAIYLCLPMLQNQGFHITRHAQNLFRLPPQLLRRVRGSSFASKLQNGLGNAQSVNQHRDVVTRTLYSNGIIGDVEKPGANDISDALTTRDTQELLELGRGNELTDIEVEGLIAGGQIALRSLETTLQDHNRAVRIRRKALSSQPTNRLATSIDLSDLPYQQYDWSRVYGACCENVIGYMPIPVGVVGPLLVDGIPYHVPLATTEGVLVASTMRGCKAVNLSGGAQTVIVGDGMTRAPVVTFPNLERAAAARTWLASAKGQGVMKRAFDSTSRFARLTCVTTNLVGSQLFIRFKATTGDAMGMNMISKGAEAALKEMGKEGFPDMQCLSLSGNYCADKKAAAINWIEGRGKSVVAQARVPADVIASILKVDVDTLVGLNQSKNLVGSAVAGALGGFNAHAANIVAAVFIATGQDAAQVVESASCLTVMTNVQGELHISVSMPSLEVATVGGGTILRPQSAMLRMLGVQGPHAANPGDNAGRLARIIAAAVLAGELSLCGALAAGQLVKSHMQYNRKASA